MDTQLNHKPSLVNGFVSVKRSIEYRLAGLCDFPQIRLLLLGMADEVGLFSVDELKAAEVVTSALRNNRVFVAVVGERIVGSVGFGVTSVWYSSDKMLSDYWMYVLPEYRNNLRVAITLLKMLRDAADLLQMTLMVGVVGVKETEKKSRLYRRYFTSVGETFFRRT